MKTLPLRTKLLTIALPPLAVLATVVAYGMKLSYLDPAAVDGVELQGDLRVLSLAGLAGVLGSALVLILVTRSVTGPLRRLTTAADELSTTRLPALVESLRDAEAAPLPPAELLGLDSDDELGRLARALDSVQLIAVEIHAAQQGLVREGLSTLVINLARRSQALVERQLSLIDQLETSEQHPDRLEDLYKLDHLATRMRRNAESLLVLAGAEPSRRRGTAVQLTDVVRVAVGQVEDYRHVQLGRIAEGEVGSIGAVDLAHLLSELLENATRFSPPEVPVTVEGAVGDDGSYRLEVIDHGTGMSQEALAEANRLLAEPPELGIHLSRSLGFLVVGRLAARLGVTLHLSASSGSGVTATAILPASLLLGSTPADPAPTFPAASPEAGSLPTPEAGSLSSSGAGSLPSPETGSLPSSGAGSLPTLENGLLLSLESALHPGVPPVGLRGQSQDPMVPVASADDDHLSRQPEEPDEPAFPVGDANHGPGEVGADGIGTDGPLLPWGSPAPTPPVREAPPWVDPRAWWSHPSQGGGPAGDRAWPFDRSGGVVPTPRRLADALPEGEAFEQGVSALLAPAGPAPAPLVEPPVPIPDGRSDDPSRTEAGLVRRRPGEPLPAEPPGRPVVASSFSPEDIREMLARFRSGIRHGRPNPAGRPDPATTPNQEEPNQEETR